MLISYQKEQDYERFKSKRLHMAEEKKNQEGPCETIDRH